MRPFGYLKTVGPEGWTKVEISIVLASRNGSFCLPSWVADSESSENDGGIRQRRGEEERAAAAAAERRLLPGGDSDARTAEAAVQLGR